MTTRRGSRNGYRRRGRSTPKPGAWFNNQSAPAVVTAGGSAFFDLFPTGPGNLQSTFEAGFTCLRCIAEVDIQAVLSASSSHGAFGIAVVSRDALDSAAIPDAITGLQDWYWHRNFWLRGRDDEMVREKIDLRTARKIRGSERTLAFVLNVAIGVASLEFSFNHRSWITQ